MLNYKKMYEELLQKTTDEENKYLDREEKLKGEINKLIKYNEMLKSQNFSLMQDIHYNYIFK